ncbi:esterase/lipase family protein [Corynebacterium sp. YSMAA1_1_F7]|uniref:esterase/lipase family protein n=1 Tax=Corynebacterium sp. YSMAA1_1_F7 TaxID=3383590 RepID=UPI0038D0DA29
MDAFIPKFLSSLLRDNPLPEGVNKWDTPLDGATPTVLIHGTWLNAYNTWDYVAKKLIAAGHPVFAVNYGKDRSAFVGKAAGVYANNFLRTSQEEVAAFIDEVIERTGASKVNLVGHSQGVAQARLYLSDSGGADRADVARNKVDRLVGVGPAHHGTTLSGVSTLAERVDPHNKSAGFLEKLLGGAAIDQRVGSEFGEHLNREGDTTPGVDYTMITAKYDGIATPRLKQVMVAGEGARVRNLSVQDDNPFDLSGHLAMLYSPRVADLILEALEPGEDGPATYRAAHPLRRGVVLPMMGEFRMRRRRG